MHMADALLSPAVGGGMWVAAAALSARASVKLRSQPSESLAPMMAVLGAFVFAAQMINFSIPGTGSSGHIGGGLLLAILLGPHAAFLALASVLTIQALFFADGGLLALGCNMINLGVFPCYIAYPLIYRPLAGDGSSPSRRLATCIIASMAGMAMGAFAVVAETGLSGISELPVGAFILLMVPIHLAIGLVEGGVTAAVIGFVSRAQPEWLVYNQAKTQPRGRPFRRIAACLLGAALLTGGLLSSFASENPDGLEWSIEKMTGKKEIDGIGHPIHATLAGWQSKTSFMPDYDFRKDDAASKDDVRESAANPGTSLAGVLGTALTLLLAGGIGLFLRLRSRKHP